MATVHDKNQGGRPVVFTAEMKEDFLEALAMGRGNLAACRVVGIARPTLHLHLARDADFRERYQEAKRLAVDVLLDEAGELAEKAAHATTLLEVAGLKLRIHFLWWQAARIAPRRWDKRAVGVTMSEADAALDLAKRAAFLEALSAR